MFYSPLLQSLKNLLSFLGEGAQHSPFASFSLLELSSLIERLSLQTNQHSSTHQSDQGATPAHSSTDLTVASPSDDNATIVRSHSSATDPETKKLETIVFFDWDDTLLPSHFVAAKGYNLSTRDADRNAELDAALREHEKSVTALLQQAASFGQVHIVTNAETGWVELSAKKFLPGLVPHLERVQIISARSTYERMFPDQPLQWKFYAMQQKLALAFSHFHHSTHKNVLSFGDSNVEREAIRNVTRGLNNTFTKTVKFVERPTVDQLQRQVELVTKCFAYFSDTRDDMDLQLTVTPSA